MRLVVTRTPQETEEEGYRYALELAPGSVICLCGPLGCGKTVFVKGMARALEVREQVTSPTFLIVQEYTGRIPLLHMDLYRLRAPEELEDIGLRDYLSSGGVTVIEWAERAAAVLPAARRTIDFSFRPDGGREIRFQGDG